MIINYLSSYDRSFVKLDKLAQEKSITAIDSLLEFFKTHQKPKGLGLKKMRKNFWEIRIDIRNRIIFQFETNIINFVLVGDHAAVKKLLKNI